MTDADWRRWRDWRQDRDILRPQSKKGAEAAAGLDVDHDPPLAKAVDFLKSELTGGGTVSGYFGNSVADWLCCLRRNSRRISAAKKNEPVTQIRCLEVVSSLASAHASSEFDRTIRFVPPISAAILPSVTMSAAPGFSNTA